jgi:hypothetical protein
MENGGKCRQVARFHTIHSNSHFFGLIDTGQPAKMGLSL